MADKYREINRNWEDHMRYAITIEEWSERSQEFLRWL